MFYQFLFLHGWALAEEPDQVRYIACGENGWSPSNSIWYVPGTLETYNG